MRAIEATAFSGYGGLRRIELSFEVFVCESRVSS